MLLVNYGRTQAGKPRKGQLASPNFIIQIEHRIIKIITLGKLFSFKEIRDLLFFLVKDFADILQTASETHNGLVDLHSLLAAIAQTVVDTDKLQQAIFSLQAAKLSTTPISLLLQTLCVILLDIPFFQP